MMNLIKYLTPINLAEEKEKYFSSRRYNPQFRYCWNEFQAVEWAANHSVYADLINAVRIQNYQNITRTASTTFDTEITQQLLEVSKKIVETAPTLLSPEPIEQVIQAFDQAFNLLELTDYSVKVVDQHGETSLFQHAAEYVMTEVALRGSLREVIEFLLDLGFSKELAWQRAIRHKFGFIDTTQPGDIMKPSMYFYHQQLIKQLSSDEKFRLFVGKISTNELQLFPVYKGLIPLSILSEFYKWSA